jgi:putative transposase
MYIPGYTYHVVQRGNNREACFFDTENYLLYLNQLSESLTRYGAELHSYVLMTNHVHLLMTPHAEDSISRIMKVLASRYAFFLNKSYGRTGTVWEGRHKSSIVQTDSYLLKCYRYIELNPVAATMVESPEQYRWSSYGANAWGDRCDWLTPHPTYFSLGNSLPQRLQAYRRLFELALEDNDRLEIRKATHYCLPLGDDRFRQQIEETLGRRVGFARRGRPKGQSSCH